MSTDVENPTREELKAEVAELRKRLEELTAEADRLFAAYQAATR